MKRKVTNGTGLHTYLAANGVLNNESDAEIARHKKIYWSKYRKDWKKNKRQQSKRYVLLFPFKEAKTIDKKAGKLRITAAKFIKQAALSREHLIGPVLIGEVRERLMLHTKRIETMMTEPRIPGPVRAEILTSVHSVEKAVLSLLSLK